MCRLKQWYAGVEGYVVQCMDCGHVQLGFGTTVLSLEKADLKRFTHMIANEAESLVFYSEEKKCVIVPTPCTICQVCLSGIELMALHRMLQTVDDEMMADALLRLFI